MKKLVVLLLILLITLSVLSACKSNKNTSTEPTTYPTTKEAQSTGYPDGWVQQSYVFINNNLYVFDDNTWTEEVPDGFEYAGDIIKIIKKELPKNNFEATLLETGYKVYVNNEKIDSVYVFSGQMYQKFVLAK